MMPMLSPTTGLSGILHVFTGIFVFEYLFIFSFFIFCVKSGSSVYKLTILFFLTSAFF